MVKRYELTKARELTDRRSITNASFSVDSIVESPVEPKSYDVILFLGVLGKGDGETIVGLGALKNLLMAIRRQIVIRYNLQTIKTEFQLTEILSIMEHCDFDGIAFPRRVRYGNIIVGNRRGTDARLNTVPPLMLVPTEQMLSQANLKGAKIGSHADFA